MFLGAAIGVLLSNVTGLVMIAGVAIGVGAMVTAMLRLPLTAVLLTTIFLGADGVKTMPLIIVAVVISYMITARLNVTENAHG
jgi:H+/Cl- antiporter ClcA